MDEARQMVLKFLCQVDYSCNEIAKHMGYTKSTNNLCKKIATYVKKQFTGEKVENKQVKRGFLIGTKEL